MWDKIKDGVAIVCVTVIMIGALVLLAKATAHVPPGFWAMRHI